ncbi:hypothetical protein V6N13_076068 [Hibiscus sabdariffa]|uniref:Uncharacterized protein n=1 Tax=Hibiscus sabdariffa TaxID=183260 RepID=A0ABR2UDE0_9ROSI
MVQEAVELFQVEMMSEFVEANYMCGRMESIDNKHHTAEDALSQPISPVVLAWACGLEKLERQNFEWVNLQQLKFFSTLLSCYYLSLLFGRYSESLLGNCNYEDGNRHFIVELKVGKRVK